MAHMQYFVHGTVLWVSKNTFSPLQVKNKPRDEESEHAFILGSMDCTVVNNIH